MERDAFFKALSFLTTAYSSSEDTANAWPPRIHGSVGTHVILKNHLLSVEPKQSEPACFASHPGVDPAMFHLDVCIVTTLVEEKVKASTTSPAASSVSTSLSLSQSPKVPSQQSIVTDNHQETNKNRIERAHLILHIDDKLIFRVDLAQLCGMQLHENPNDNNNDDIPNLVLHFDSCSFRIFSPEALGDNNQDYDVAVLKTAASRMKKAVSAFQKQSIVFQGNDNYFTPLDQNTDSSGMSTTTWNDAAQCENRNSHGLASRSNSQEHGGDATAAQDGSTNDECASVLRVKRKRSALDRSWEGLHSLQTILSIPRDATQTKEDVSDSIAPALSAAAEELAASYCRKKDIRKAVESCSNDMTSCETQLSNVFASAFPPPTRNRRNGASPAKSTAPEENNAQALLETAKALLQKQKNSVKERLELSLLPTRD